MPYALRRMSRSRRARGLLLLSDTWSLRACCGFGVCAEAAASAHETACLALGILMRFIHLGLRLQTVQRTAIITSP